jgi:hypothetical protein
MTKWDLHKIEEAFTAAAVEPNLWSSALDCVSAQTESRGALILPIQGNPLPHIPRSARESLEPQKLIFAMDGIRAMSAIEAVQC